MKKTHGDINYSSLLPYLIDVNWLYILGSGIPELENRVKKPSNGLLRHKTDLS